MKLGLAETVITVCTICVDCLKLGTDSLLAGCPRLDQNLDTGFICVYVFVCVQILV